MMMIFIGTLFCNLHRDANGLYLRQFRTDAFLQPVGAMTNEVQPLIESKNGSRRLVCKVALAGDETSMPAHASGAQLWDWVQRHYLVQSHGGDFEQWRLSFSPEGQSNFDECFCDLSRGR